MTKRDWELVRGFLFLMLGLVLLSRDFAQVYIVHAPPNYVQIGFHLILIALGIRALLPKRKRGK